MAGWLAIGVAVPAYAHPHVFIDTKVTAILDAEGRLTAIRLRWDYDSLLSMVVVEDKGADADGDGLISPGETVVLDGFDMTWVEGFDGDTILYQGETLLPLEPGPQDWATGWTAEAEGGHLWSEHTRRLAVPVDPAAGPVSITVYDVTDYTAYALTDATLKAAEGGAVACRIGAPAVAEDVAEGGIFTTLGLFLFGGEGGSTLSLVPAPARGRVVLVLSCD